jgi:hypothetical protein
MTGSRGVRGHRDGDPGKTIDSLADHNGSGRISIHVVDGNEDIVRAIVADAQRQHIVADSGGADRHGQQHTEDDNRPTQFTHTPSQWFLIS